MRYWQQIKCGLLVDLPADGHIHSLNAGSTGDDGNLVGFLHRVIDLEEADRETMHLLVFLLMQFLSRSDQVAVLYYLSCLQGYIWQDLTPHLLFLDKDIILCSDC
jgi:hypothetical protein